MTPFHPRWNDFCGSLSEKGKVGCDFIKNEKDIMVWDGIVYPDPFFVESILNTILEIDVDKSMEYFDLYLLNNYLINRGYGKEK